MRRRATRLGPSDRGLMTAHGWVPPAQWADYLTLRPALARLPDLRARLAVAVAGERRWLRDGPLGVREPRVSRRNILAWAINEGLDLVEAKVARRHVCPLLPPRPLTRSEQRTRGVEVALRHGTRARLARLGGGDAHRGLAWVLREGLARVEGIQAAQARTLRWGVPMPASLRQRPRPGTVFVSTRHAEARGMSLAAPGWRVAAAILLATLGTLLGALGATAHELPLLMATNYFVRSTDGSDADNGTTWALAEATISAGCGDMAAGDKLFISDNHAESAGAAKTWTSPGTAGNPCYLFCVDDTGDPASPTVLQTSATATTTGANSFTLNGYAYLYGVALNCGTGSTSASIIFNLVAGGMGWDCEHATFAILNTGTSTAGIQAGTANANAGYVRWRDCVTQFSATGQGMSCSRVRFEWTGGVLIGTKPTTFFITRAVWQGATVILTQLEGASFPGTSKNLVDVSNLTSNCYIQINETLLSASFAVTTGSWADHSSRVELVNCAITSGGTKYPYYMTCLAGTVSHATSPVRVGGASDGGEAGEWQVGAWSFNMVPRSSGATPIFPLYTPWIAVYIPDSLQHDIGLEFYRDNATALLSREVAVESIPAEMASGIPWASDWPGANGSFISRNLLTADADQATSTATWTGSPSNPNPQIAKITDVTLKPGWRMVRMGVTGPGDTNVYVCPRVSVSNPTIDARGRVVAVPMGGVVINMDSPAGSRALSPHSMRAGT